MELIETIDGHDSEGIVDTEHSEHIEEKVQLLGTLENSISVMDQLEVVAGAVSTLASKDSISTEEFNNAKQLTGLVFKPLGLEAEDVFKFFKNNNGISMEDAAEISKKSVGGFKTAVREFTNHAESTKNRLVTMAGSMRKELSFLKQKRKSLGNGKASIKFKCSRNIAAGKCVDSYSEYLEELSNITSLAESSLIPLVEFSKGDFLSSFKLLFSLVSGYNEFFENKFYEIKEVIDTIKANPGMSKQHTRNPKENTYSSKELLGCIVLSCSEPSEHIGSGADIETLHRAYQRYSCTASSAKYISSGSVIFTDVSVSLLDKHIALLEKLVNVISEHQGGIAVFLSRCGAIQQLVNSVTSGALGTAIWALLFYNFRIYLKGCWLVTKMGLFYEGHVYRVSSASLRIGSTVAEKLSD